MITTRRAGSKIVRRPARTGGITELTFGEQRLILIMRAMVKLPPILLLNEPCLGLDNNERAQVMALVDHIAANSRTHILFVAHDDADKLTCLNRSLEFRKDGDCYRGSISDIPSPDIT